MLSFNPIQVWLFLSYFVTHSPTRDRVKEEYKGACKNCKKILLAQSHIDLKLASTYANFDEKFCQLLLKNESLKQVLYGFKMYMFMAT